MALRNDTFKESPLKTIALGMNLASEPKWRHSSWNTKTHLGKVVSSRYWNRQGLEKLWDRFVPKLAYFKLHPTSSDRQLGLTIDRLAHCVMLNV